MGSDLADMRALGALILYQMRGRLRRWLRMMKQPKYLIGLAVGLLWYAWIILGRTISRPHGDVPTLAALTPAVIATLRLGVSVVVAALLTLGLVMPARVALPFEEAEIHHLFTAPIPRRTLLRYGILRAFPALIVGSFISVILIGGGPLAGRLARWPFVFALFGCWMLWSKAVTTWKARQKELAPRQARRNLAFAGAGVAAFWVAVILAARPLVRAAARALESPASWRDAFVDVQARAWALEILLAPLATPLRLLMATGWTDRLIGAASVIVLLVVLEEWCVRSAVQFEDATLERARVVADVRQRGIAALRRKVKPQERKQVPFMLRSVGRPEIGITWKNLMAVSRLPERTSIQRGLMVLLGTAILLAVGTSVPATQAIAFGAGAMLGIGGLVLMAWMPLLSGSLWRNDMRTDLLHVDQLRTWPISAWRLVLAEVAAPAWQATLVGMFGAGLVAASLAATLAGASLDQPWARATHPLISAAGKLGMSPILLLAAFPLAALPVVASVALLSVSVQNLVVLLFPTWARLGRDRARDRGAAAAGQRMMAFVGLAGVMAIALLPGCALVALIVLLQRAAGIPFMALELPPLALVVALPMFGASALLTWFGARAWERLDPSAEMLTAGVS
jgi:hypothetical protein